MWTQLKFTALPNIMPLTMGVLALDILSRFAPQTHTVRAVQSMLFGVLYLAITCFCGILAAYATQRLSLPLQDPFFERTDLALGVNWFDVAHWVDDRPVIHAILKLAYGTMSTQIALPVVVLAFLGNAEEVRQYLLSFAIALTVTIIISAFLPAAGPIALVDRTTFHVDVLGGTCVAFAAFFLASRIIGAKDALLSGFLATYPILGDTAGTK